MNSEDIQSAQRRRQSTIESPESASSSILDEPASSGDIEAKSTNARSLKAPPTTANRNSIGIWGGTKSATSTPNLTNLTMNSDFFGPYPPQSTASGKKSSPGTSTKSGSGSGSRSRSGSGSGSGPIPAAGTGAGPGSGMGSRSATDPSPNTHGTTTSSAGSFKQQRKRSEIIGGIKTFDDKDAPPIPVMPTHHSNNSTISHQSTSSSLTNSYPLFAMINATDVPELPSLLSKEIQGFGPLDTLPSVDNINDTQGVKPQDQDQEGQSTPKESQAIAIPLPKTTPSNLDVELDRELSNSVSTVQSWLRMSHSDLGDTTTIVVPHSTLSTNTPTTTATTATIATITTTTTDITSVTLATPPNSTDSSTVYPHMATTSSSAASTDPQDLRRPSHTSTASTLDDDSESEDINVPVAVLTMGSNRLSKMYETGSVDLNQSETSLYYSTVSNDDLGEISSIPVSGKVMRNSIRFSEYGLLMSKDLPSTPVSGSTPGLLGPQRPDKPLPQRPVSLFMSSSAPQETTSAQSASRAPTALGGSSLLAPMTYHSNVGARPATICVSGDEANKYPAIAPVSTSSTRATSASSTGAAAPVTVTVTITPLSAATSLLPPTSPLPQEPSKPELESAQKPEESMDSLALKTAKRCITEDETFLRRDEISSYLGAATSNPRFSQLILMYYMRHFNFSGKRLDVAFRQLCHKLMLRGETQEVDRVLEAFAARFVECNPESIFGHKDVVHAITYSILLLNTDLHVVQQSNSSKMSRSAFVKNTLQVVMAQTEYREQQERELSPEDSSAHGLTLSSAKTGGLSVNGSGSGGKKRTPSVKSWKSGTSQQSKSSKMGPDPKANGGHGNGKWWLQELETLLKEIYTTVKHYQILLPTPNNAGSASVSAPTTPTAAGFTHSSPQNLLKPAFTGTPGFPSWMTRQGFLPNVLPENGFGGSGGLGGSTAPPISGSGGNTNGGSLFGIVRRSSLKTNTRAKQLRLDAIQRLNAQSAGAEDATSGSASSSPSSNRSAIRSAPGSANNSGSNSSRPTLTLPPTSASQNSDLGLSGLPSPASSVFSQHEKYAQRQHESNNHKPSAIKGHPGFRMEGILFRKHLLERADKKASHRAWKQLLVVLDQGGLSLFRADGQLGQASEEQGILFDEIRLQHTITNILPPPGYSSTRRHVFAIQLHTGAVYLFQAASAKECDEWAKTCNYWAARTTKEPLPGGVINMEYGWGRALELLSNQLGEPISSGGGPQGQTNTMGSTNSSGCSLVNQPQASSSLATPASSNISLEDDDTKSINNSMMGGSSFLNFPPPASSASTSSAIMTPIFSGGGVGTGIGNSKISIGNSGVGSGRSASIKSSSSRHQSFGSSLSNVSLGDRTVLFEWAAPLPTMSMSMLAEEEQCDALKRYVAGLESEMEVHQEHRGPMMKLFLPKSHNYTKAFNNWERRSRHLLKEMVKYQIYVESLEQSLKAQQDHQRQQDEENAKLEEELQHLDVEDDDEEGDHALDSSVENRAGQNVSLLGVNMDGVPVNAL
ncbi:hypothetical protein BG011_006228 [Mortierella polycephala]|uniref:SEC7 domain-containing protein n=1 Tax=Mortierella polycephala TaxID=41804 RepID=A0A9P6PTD2_9FUNG|nr:hypothetical protein BG011_006228 [Mortierella polycephala]